MNEREDFLEALAANEDDTALRALYADWLDDNGEHEEAQRQRKWPIAKAWLVRFCQDNNPPPNSDSEVIAISPDQLIEMGRHAVKKVLSRSKYNIPYEAIELMLKAGWEVLDDAKLLEDSNKWEFSFSFGNNEKMLYSLAKNLSEFWKHWSVITGIPLLPGIEEKTHFRCAC